MATLFDTLIKEHLVTAEQLNDAREKQVGAKRPLHELLVSMGFVTEQDLLETASRVYHMPMSDLRKETVEQEAIGLVPYEVAERHGVFPVRREGDALILAMSNPQDVVAMDEVRIHANMRIKPVLASRSDINRAVDKYYQTDESLYDILKHVPGDVDFEVLDRQGVGKVSISDRSLKDETSPVVRLFNLIVKDALKSRASDIHIEPEEKMVKVRYRIDGDLRAIMEVPVKLHPELAARIKILGEMDIAEKRKPQDGRLKLLYQNRKVDVRIATIPTVYGEKVEMRILDPKDLMVSLDGIGFDPPTLDRYKRHIMKPQGMVLVTGPTGSGKTTTLYATLNYIKSEKKNIVTIEDPIEYLIEGINQTQINPAKNLDFSTALRSLLRQDPNVILVGEIRDRETADISFRSSLTGHIVFSTLHTNSAIGAIPRLLDIGLEPYLIASSLLTVVAQRLVKKICPSCKVAYEPDPAEIERYRPHLEAAGTRTFYRGKGCEACGFTGFLGRMPIFEVLDVSDQIKALISRGAQEDEILLAARREGFQSLSQAAIRKVIDGVTTFEELARVVVLEEAETKARVTKRGDKFRVLAADDEEDILRLVGRRLSDAGYDVVKARDGGEALQLAFAEKPDLIITDATMPKMDGFELIRKLRSTLETAVIPVIMLTARQDKASELKGLDAGADDYITKPFDIDKLLARVKMLLRRK